jgi:hypothetical protein
MSTSLEDAMDRLAKVLTELPDDISIDVSVRTDIHDDIPPLFVEDDGMSTRVVETLNGMPRKTINLFIKD